MKPGHRHNFVG